MINSVKIKICMNYVYLKNHTDFLLSFFSFIYNVQNVNLEKRNIMKRHQKIIQLQCCFTHLTIYVTLFRTKISKCILVSNFCFIFSHLLKVRAVIFRTFTFYARHANEQILKQTDGKSSENLRKQIE